MRNVRSDRSAVAIIRWYTNMISVAMIGRNEACTLRATLESVAPYAREIVFVDTGSTDSTPTIAAAYGARVSYFSWTDDFSAARNAALNNCTGRWVLTIDCDEVLIAGIAGKKFFEMLDQDSSAVAFMVPIHNVLQYDRRDTHFDVRLFRKESGIYFCNPIHESVTPSINRLFPNVELELSRFQSIITDIPHQRKMKKNWIVTIISS